MDKSNERGERLLRRAQLSAGERNDPGRMILHGFLLGAKPALHVKSNTQNTVDTRLSKYCVVYNESHLCNTCMFGLRKCNNATASVSSRFPRLYSCR